jgi:hypothetical protein
VIDRVLFASYGTPSGGCDDVGGSTFKIDPSCHAANSTAVVHAACVGRNTCMVQVSNLAFGVDPCHLTRKRLAVLVHCAAKHSDGASPAAPGSRRTPPAAPGAHRTPPAALDVSAWVVRYPWRDDDSRFESSNATLNAVWRLARDTLKVTSLDTATDSNTRERLPYEADGYITGDVR